MPHWPNNKQHMIVFSENTFSLEFLTIVLLRNYYFFSH